MWYATRGPSWLDFQSCLTIWECIMKKNLKDSFWKQSKLSRLEGRPFLLARLLANIQGCSSTEFPLMLGWAFQWGGCLGVFCALIHSLVHSVSRAIVGTLAGWADNCPFLPQEGHMKGKHASCGHTFFSSFWDKVSCSSGWLWSRYEVEDELLTFCVHLLRVWLGLQVCVCTITPGLMRC